jgi:hypothetical protein
MVSGRSQHHFHRKWRPRNWKIAKTLWLVSTQWQRAQVLESLESYLWSSYLFTLLNAPIKVSSPHLRNWIVPKDTCLLVQCEEKDMWLAFQRYCVCSYKMFSLKGVVKKTLKSLYGLTLHILKSCVDTRLLLCASVLNSLSLFDYVLRCHHSVYRFATFRFVDKLPRIKCVWCVVTFAFSIFFKIF